MDANHHTIPQRRRSADPVDQLRALRGFVQNGTMRGIQTRAALAVWLVLFQHADANWECWTKHATIAREAGIKVDTVTRAIAQLREHELVKVVTAGSGRAWSRYRLLPAGWESPAGETDEGPIPIGGRVGPASWAGSDQRPTVTNIVERTYLNVVDDEIDRMGLFAHRVVLDELIERWGFDKDGRDACNLLRRFGVGWVWLGIQHARLLKARGKLTGNGRGFIVAFADPAKGRHVDIRVIDHLEAQSAVGNPQSAVASPAPHDALLTAEDKALWAALTDEQRLQLSRQVIADAHPDERDLLSRSRIDGNFIKPRIIDLALHRGLWIASDATD